MNEKVLATTSSLPDTYYEFGGVYDVALDGSAVAALAQHPIAITSTKNGLSIAESPIRIYGDDRNIYLDDAGERTTINLLIRYLGGPLQNDVQVALATGRSGTLPDPHFLTFPCEITVKAGADRFSFAIADNGGPAGFLALNFTVGGQALYFVNVRKYPQDDYGQILKRGQISWDDVYAICLRFYYLLFPAMSKRIPLNDQATINAVAGEILKRISPAYRDTTLCMPITRSMSPGKVKLLTAYLQSGAAVETRAPAAAEPSGSEKARQVIGNKLT